LTRPRNEAVRGPLAACARTGLARRRRSLTGVGRSGARGAVWPGAGSWGLSTVACPTDGENRGRKGSAMELDHVGLLEQLSSDRRAHKLIRDRVDDRWFVYAFDQNPPEVTSVPKELALRALQQHWVEENEVDRRGDLSRESYEVYLLTDEGERELRKNDA
jgi:hypothetical protein